MLICSLIAVVAACFIASAAQALEISSDPATLRTLCSLRPYISQYLPISPYISQALEISSDLGASLRKLAAGWAVPSLQPWGYQQSVATLGAVVMPHNLYLHSSLVLSRGPPLEQHQEVHAAICYSRIESPHAAIPSPHP